MKLVLMFRKKTKTRNCVLLDFIMTEKKIVSFLVDFNLFDKNVNVRHSENIHLKRNTSLLSNKNVSKMR